MLGSYYSPNSELVYNGINIYAPKLILEIQVQEVFTINRVTYKILLLFHCYNSAVCFSLLFFHHDINLGGRVG